MKRKISVNLGNLILSLSEILDITNHVIEQHQQRTAFIALEISRYIGIEGELLEDIFTAALLHDIGAITIEEKVAVYKFELSPNDMHANRGAVLLNKTPWFKNVSQIVRNHHTNYIDFNDTIENPIVLGSQILYLADYVERQIEKNVYILHQTENVLEKVKNLSETNVNSKILEYFLDISKREEFWLDLSSPRLFPVLLHNGPYRNVEVGIEGISVIAELYKDIIDFKSRFTATHTTGVSACAEKLGQLFGLTDLEVNMLRLAGNFHDIGKLVIPNEILEKPGKLTSEEFAVIKCHTYYTYYVLNSIPGLYDIAEWAAYHHEKLNGNGYPFKCKAEDIDTGSRIVAVADIFTALSEDRPYRPSMDKEKIIEIIKGEVENNALDPKIVDLLFDNYDEVEKYVKLKQDEAKEFYENQFVTIKK